MARTGWVWGLQDVVLSTQALLQRTSKQFLKAQHCDSVFPYISNMESQDLFCSWNFVPVNLPHLFLSSCQSPPFWKPPVYSLCLWLYFCFVVHLFSSLHMSVKSYIVYLFLSDYFIGQIASSLVNVVKNVLLYAWIGFCCIFVCIHTHMYVCICTCVGMYICPPIHLWTLRLLLYLDYCK